MEKVNKRILWIDDDLVEGGLLLSSYLSVLRDAGLIVDCCTRLSEAKDKLENGINDTICIILDISIPAEDIVPLEKSRGGMIAGTIFLQNILEKIKDKEIPNIPILVFTNLYDPFSLKVCQDNNIQYTLKKDMLPIEFRDEIIKFIDDHD